MLHTGVQGDHGEVVRIRDVVNIAGQTEGKFSHGNQQGIAAAGSGTLDIHRRAAGGLTQTAAHVLSQSAQTFDQTERGGGFTFTEGRGSDGGYFNEFAVWLVLQAIHDLDEVKLRRFAVGNDLVGEQTELFAEFVHGRKGFFCFLSDLPVLVDGGIEHDSAGFIGVFAVGKIDSHKVPP